MTKRLHSVNQKHDPQRLKVEEGKNLLSRPDNKGELYTQTMEDVGVLIGREEVTAKQRLTRFESFKEKVTSELVQPCKRIMKEYAKERDIETSPLVI